ncbi:conserved hypothetical protein [Candidatus Nitrotoga sp. HW29]|uniref:TIGR04282 family arsenosugar biosynthesis glycosyltransferase n=1 Tax=Candidatus Nitrotoga sp. HW29 TaxID=2886963 RepID=UPI001EF2E93A|nr:TIGR04282 family arsenosugar biosynthesis glycosyltransferase [Candidatus Nitrotoga sp. HW29]CAH1904198.1 conserved hypothetical protein [Candidatus Nitrotoga sp. HW29]
MTPTRIMIFAKAPQPGFVKTRLIPLLGAEAAAKLAQQMLFNTLFNALAADIGAVELCSTPKIDDIAWQNIALPVGIEITDQGEGDLGARLARAAERAIENTGFVLLIGTDCVETSAALLREAAQLLNEHDAVIHCTADGGYALLGLKRFSAVLFNDMPWNTDTLASTIIVRIRQLGWSLHVGQLLHNVNTPQDLKYLLPKIEFP